MARISWSNALANYLKDETQSYASIASSYGVSLQAVKKRAGRESWVSLRQKSIQKVNQMLPEITGEDMAMIDARHAQIGKVLQAAALKAIKERNLNPENFMQAVRAIVEGVKIERETLDMKEAREVIEKDRCIFNTPEMAREASMNKYNVGIFNNLAMARKYAIKEPVTQSQTPLLAVAPVNKPKEQTPSNKPLVDPKLLEQIQERLLEMQGNLNKLKEKLDTKQAEVESSTSLSGWH